MTAKPSAWELADKERKLFERKIWRLEKHNSELIMRISALRSPPASGAEGGVREALKQEDDRPLPTYGQIPWKQLGRDVIDAITGRREDYTFPEGMYPGHHTLTINFNSLARIADKYRWHGIALASSGNAGALDQGETEK